MKDLSSRDWVWKWLFRRQGFLDQKYALFSLETFMILWPSRLPSIHRQWFLAIWFQVSWHHTLKYCFFNDQNQKYKDSLQMYWEFLLTLRIDAHPASIISGLEIWTICQMPRFCCFIVPEIYFIAKFILFVSLKF